MARQKRVAGYVRLSKETEDTTSPQRQRRAIRRLCDERGWTLGETFEDIDVSAFNGRHRPGLTRLMKRLGEFDAIVFWKLDRLSRSSVEAGQIAERCKESNVDLVATDMNLDTTSAGGKFIYTVLAAAGEMESARTSERSRSMTAYKKERGEWIGRIPYGWKIGADKRLVADRSEQAILRKAARRFVSGASYSELARDYGFNAPTVLHRILDSARVQEALGDLGDDLAAAIRTRKGDRVPTSTRSFLGGIARCAVCGGPLRLSSTRAGRFGRWTTYRCPSTGHVGISGRWLEDHVSAAVLDAIDLKALTKRMRQRQSQPKAAEVAAIEARMEELEDAFGDGTLAKDAFRRQRDRQLAKLAEVRQASQDEAAPDLPLDLARRLPEAWPTLSITARRDVVRAVVRSIVVEKAPPRSNGHAPETSRVKLVWRT